MSSDRSLQASFWSIVLLNTLGSVDMPGAGNRKMPSPRNYVAIVIVWATLGIVSDTGRGKPAAVIGWVLVLTSLVGNVLSGGNVGTAGTRLLNFLNSATKLAASGSQGGTGGGASSSPSGGTPGGTTNRA